MHPTTKLSSPLLLGGNYDWYLGQEPVQGLRIKSCAVVHVSLSLCLSVGRGGRGGGLVNGVFGCGHLQVFSKL